MEELRLVRPSEEHKLQYESMMAIRVHFYTIGAQNNTIMMN